MVDVYELLVLSRSTENQSCLFKIKSHNKQYLDSQT